MRAIVVLGGVVAALAFATSGGAVQPNVLQLETVASVTSPIYVTAPREDTSRVFIVQQGGTIRLVKDGILLPTPFLVVSGISSGGERGLLSMAFSPDYATTGRFYVYYTKSTSGSNPGAMAVAEYRRDAANPDIADPTSRRVVIEIPHPGASNHNGGQLQFGPDGYLYMATGDGGGGGDPFRSAQNLEDLRGKLLRIDPLRPTRSSAETYTIPAGNPFVGVAGRDEIWAYGLRNPWRFSFDRLTGDLTIGDVGQGAWEEIDFALAPNAGRGVNFGWSCMEGRHLYGNCPEPQNHVQPVREYSHDDGCSITGGYVVRAPNLPSLAGRYVYTDYCTSGSSFGLRSVMLALPDAMDDRETGLFLSNVTSFGEDALGRVYVMGSGQVKRFNEAGPPAPPPPPPPPPPPRPPTTIVISDPGCRVPRVVGRTLASARQAIRSRQNCRVGRLRYAARSRAARGRIIGQSPRGGRVHFGLRVAVNLVVSRARR